MSAEEIIKDEQSIDDNDGGREGEDPSVTSGEGCVTDNEPMKESTDHVIDSSAIQESATANETAVDSPNEDGPLLIDEEVGKEEGIEESTEGVEPFNETKEGVEFDNVAKGEQSQQMEEEGSAKQLEDIPLQKGEVPIITESIREEEPEPIKGAESTIGELSSTEEESCIEEQSEGRGEKEVFVVEPIEGEGPSNESEDIQPMEGVESDAPEEAEPTNVTDQPNEGAEPTNVMDSSNEGAEPLETMAVDNTTSGTNTKDDAMPVDDPVRDEGVNNNSLDEQRAGVDVTFFSNLNLLPRKRPLEEDSTTTISPSKKAPLDDKEMSPQQSRDGEETVTSLTQLFKSDPAQLMNLLSKALSIDSLNDILKKEHKDSTIHLEILKQKLDKANKTLKHCNEQKGRLQEQIDQVSEEIQKKRTHLQNTREELKEMSLEEAALKEKKNEASDHCSEIRKKLYASREAVQQIHKLYGKRPKHNKELSNEA